MIRAKAAECPAVGNAVRRAVRCESRFAVRGGAAADEERSDHRRGGHVAAGRRRLLGLAIRQKAHRGTRASDRLERGDRRFMALLDRLDAVAVAPETDEEREAFVNLNTPEAYTAYVARYGDNIENIQKISRIRKFKSCTLYFNIRRFAIDRD